MNTIVSGLGTQPLYVPTNLHDTPESFMEAIEQQAGYLPPGTLHPESAFLVHNGRALVDGRTFGDSGVTNESSISINFRGRGGLRISSRSVATISNTVGGQLEPHAVDDHFCRVDNAGQGDCVLHSTIDGLRRAFGRAAQLLTAFNLRSNLVSWVQNNLDNEMPNGYTLRRTIELDQGESNRSVEEYMNKISISPHKDKFGRQVDGYYLGDTEIQMLSWMLNLNIDIYQYGNEGATSHRINSFSTAGPDRPTLSLEYGSPPPNSIIEHTQDDRGNHWQYLADSTYDLSSEHGVIIENPNSSQASAGGSTSARHQSAAVTESCARALSSSERACGYDLQWSRAV